MTERQLTVKIKTQLEKTYGGMWVKIGAGPFQVAGLPDLIGLVNGVFFGLEIKLPGKEKTLTKIQKRWLRLINLNGGIGRMITTVDKAKALVKKYAFDE